MNYYLMNKDIILRTFSIEQDALGVEKITNDLIYSDKTLPMPTGFTAIADWLNSRNYAKHKEHFKAWIKEWGIDTISGFIDITHCLSLNDTLWVKRADSSLTWSKVNLYDNEFFDVASKTAFETGLYGLELSSTSPEFTAEGHFPKCWQREEDGIYLYKNGRSGSSNWGLEPISEAISSKITVRLCDSNALDLNAVDYVLTNRVGNKVYDRLCTRCVCFTDANTAFVPFSMYLKEKGLQCNSISDVLDVMAGNKEMQQKMAKMFIIDSIIMNQDRHLSNFGFLVDSDTYTIKDFAPLFDFNLSMLTESMPDDLRDLRKYFSTFDIGHRLGGNFDTVGHALIKAYEPSFLCDIDLNDVITAIKPLSPDKAWNKMMDKLPLIKNAFNENLYNIKNSAYRIVVEQNNEELDIDENIDDEEDGFDIGDDD